MNDVNETSPQATEEKKNPKFFKKALRDTGIFLVCVVIFVMVMSAVGIKNMSTSEFGNRIGKAAVPAIFSVLYLSYIIRKFLYNWRNKSN